MIDPVLLHVIIYLVIIGVILGLINRYIPMAGGIKSILNGVVIIFTLIWVLRMFKVIGPIPGLPF